MEVQGRAKGERLVAELADEPVEFADAASEVCLAPDLIGRKNETQHFHPGSDTRECGGVTGAYLCNVRKLLAGEVDEGQVIEAGGDGGVVLDERAATGVLGEELMNARIMTQQTPVSSERKTAEITPAMTNTS